MMGTSRLRPFWPFLALLVLFAVSAALFPAVRDNAVSFLEGAFGGRRNFNFYSTLSRASLIIGMAMSVLISFRAGLINIGGEGQLVLGGLTAALVGVYLDAPPLVVWPAALFAAMLAGSLWAMFAGCFDRIFGVPLVVGSLLLNYPAVLFASYMVSHPFRDLESGITQSHRIARELRLPRFEATLLDYGVFLIVLVIVLVIFFERRSVFGYRLRMQGFSLPFARSSGFPVGRIYFQTLAISGAIAGVVGFIAVFGINHRYVDGMLVLPLYSWTGVIAVLLAGLVSWLVPLTGFFFAALGTGAVGIERAADIPREAAQIIQALIILFAAGIGHSLISQNAKGDR